MNGKWIPKVGLLMVMGLVMVFAGCGGGGGDSAPVCSPNGNIALLDAASDPLLSLTFTAVHNGTLPVDQSVFVAYNPSAGVGSILAGYPPSGVDPWDYGLGIGLHAFSVDNPLEFEAFVFDTTLAPGTYQAVWRFVAIDISGQNVLGCQDLPVTYTITAS